jgi:VCBS repeat-containing protein
MLDPEIYSANASKSIEQEASDEAARIARAIAEGRDPNAIADPAAAGGETGDEGTTTPLVVDFDNTQGNVTSGFATGPISLSFPLPQEELPPVQELAAVEPVLPTVSVQVEVKVDTETQEPDPDEVFATTPGVVVEGVSVVEGTEDVTRTVNFVISLNAVYTQDVTVTYVINSGSATSGTDYTGVLTGIVTIPAGQTSFIVPVEIVQDSNLEQNENFSIQLTSATNATINPANNSALVTIIDDDVNADNDTDAVTESQLESNVGVFASGNVLTNDDLTNAFAADGTTPLFGPLVVTTAGPVDVSVEGTVIGTITFASDGTYTLVLNNDGKSLISALPAGVEISVSAPYSITNAVGSTDSASLTITITGSNDGPVAVNDTNSLTEDAGSVSATAVLNGVLLNDTDVDGDTLTVTSIRTGGTEGSGTAGTVDGVTTLNGAYGTLVIAANGSYTYTLYTVGQNPTAYGAVQALDDGDTPLTDVFNYTMSDGTTNDTATLTISITGLNDAPTIIANATSDTVYEAGLLSGSGTGPGSSISATGTFTIADTDGLDDIKSVTIAGQTFTVEDYAKFAAYTPAIIAAAPIAIAGGYGTVDITGYSNGTFNYTYTLTNTYDGNGLGAGYNTVPDADSFVVSVSDGTAPAATATVNIDIVDDVALFTIVNDGVDAGNAVSLSALNPATNTTYNGQFADWEFGADGFSSATVTVPSNVTVLSTSATQIVLGLYEGTTQVGTLTLNADGTDSLQVLHRDSEVVFTPVAATSAVAGGPSGSLIVDLGAATNYNILVRGSDGDNILGEADDLVNTSSNGWAVKGSQGQTNQLNESIKFSFVSEVNNTTGVGIGDFKFLTEGYTGGITTATITVKVYLDASGTYDVVTLDVTSGQIVQISNLDWSAIAGTGNYVEGSLIYGVEVTSAELDGSFRLNGIEVGTNTSTPPADLSFQNITVTLTDGDGDTASQTFNVTIDGDAGNQLTVEAITGTSGNDVLNGTVGNDILIGGDGNDILTGGGGIDTFVWNSGDTGADQVTDFVMGATGDVLDIADLLTDGLSMTADSVDGHLQLQFADGSNTVVQTIDLNNIAAADTAAATNLMNQLLLSGNIDDGV